MNIMKFIRSTYNYQTACMWQLQRLMHTISSISYNCQTAYMQQLPMNTIKSIRSI
ncbi:hypothetical protein [Bacteroides pyogenes]|uniref:hypothetical protein n=1 Tax=Bacteroides pyogenes TaxID=310300 RepID=UPI0016533316|nr:hypothetical protein [Bacteroides pyogenes]